MLEKAAAIADKIFKGSKPADLPVEQPTRFELTVNLRTALAFDLSVPESVLLPANEVIRSTPWKMQPMRSRYVSSLFFGIGITFQVTAYVAQAQVVEGADAAKRLVGTWRLVSITESQLQQYRGEQSLSNAAPTTRS